MKAKQNLIPVIFIWLVNILNLVAQEIPADSIYFGFTPPGDSAIIFAPGVISLPERKERTPNYLPDYSEFYFTTTVGGAKAYSTKYQGKWETPMIDSSFRTNISDLSISESGTLACFTSWDRTYNSSTNTDIWISERINGEWQAPERLPAPVNSNEQEWGACLLDNRTIYVCKRNGSHSDIVKYIYQDEQYSPVYIPEINSNSFEWDPFIPEDESYIIFKSNRPGSYGDMDLYITYKKTDGTYTAPKNLGNKINSAVHDDCGNLTPDGKYFMFGRNNRSTGEFDIYWVSSAFIQNLRPDNLNPYLGQTPPGNTPEIFAEGILSKPNRQERVLSFTPDGKEIYFSVVNSSNSYNILYFEEIDGEWQEEKTASFITEYMDGASCVEPFISPDGTKLLFASKKGATGGIWDYNIWITERTGDNWGEPEKLGSAINTASGEWHPCITSSGNIYFARNGNIYFSKCLDDQYLNAVNLSSINSSSQDWDPYVDSDERYLIFKSNRPGGYGNMDNYISFRDTISGNWSVPQNLGDVINSDWKDDAGDISPDGKFFFYSRTNDTGEMDVYWTNTDFIEQLRSSTSIETTIQNPTEFQIFQNYPNPFNQETGISYTISRPDFIVLKVYDLLGREVVTLVDTFQPAGHYYVYFNAANMASGIYFYKMKVGNQFVKSKKMILMR